MLYKTEAIPVEASGFAETTHFDIPASGKAFKSLIDNIYSRKIEAPIRELCTNAWDAHEEAGLDEPFRLKLPTKFDPLFMVRDYGLGMSHQFIMGDFKSLFKSTKDQTNKVVGMKGLGSKSPFAYTDAFILRVFSGTTVRTYSTYIGEDGIPQLAYQGESPSDERRGVAVQFPVQMKDIDQFYDAAVRVLKGFTVLPEGLPRTVTDRLEDSSSKPVESGSFWNAHPKAWLGEGAYAKQGCVIYPIDLDKIVDGKWIKTLGLGLIIEFPIGTVQMVDSREFLAYDEETIANINDACGKIKDEIDAKVSALLVTAKTQWDLRMLFRSDIFSGLGPLARSSGHYNRILALNTYIKECLPRQKRYRGTKEQIFYSVVSADGPAYTRYDENWSEGLVDNPVFVYCGFDKKLRRNMNNRAKRYLEANPKTTGVVMLEKLPLKLFRKLGKPPILRVTDLPEIPKAERVARDPVDWKRFQEFDAEGSHWNSLKRVEEEDLEGGPLTDYYLFINGGAAFLTEPGDMAGTGLHNLHSTDRLLRFFLKSRIVFINVRLNEKRSRWPEAEYPRFREGLLDGVIEALTVPQILPMINAINWERFDESSYDRSIDAIGVERIVESRTAGYTNPLFDLVRFKERRDRLTSQQRNVFAHLSGEMRDQIIERAIALGLEVLPEVDSGPSWKGFCGFPYPLLPKKWERMARYLAEWSDDKQKDLMVQLMRRGF